MMKKYVENGIESFEPHEVLEILLFNVFPRCNTNDISHRLLNEFKSVKGVLSASVSELTSIQGIGESAAVRIRFLGDFFGYLAQEPAESVVLNKNELVFNYCKELLDISSREFFLILFLDKKNTLISKYFVYGHFNFVSPDKKAISAKALVPGCVSAVAVHNHIKDSAAASSFDYTSTSNLWRFLAAHGIELKDHLILCNNDFISMRKDDRLHDIWK